MAVSVCTLNLEPHDQRDKVSARGWHVPLQDSPLLTVQACVFEFEITVKLMSLMNISH